MAKDGTVYAGLQDNGQLKILPDGRQYEIFGGDAFFTAVDPNNANVNYEEYTGRQHVGDHRRRLRHGPTSRADAGQTAMFSTPVPHGPHRLPTI